MQKYNKKYRDSVFYVYPSYNYIAVSQDNTCSLFYDKPFLSDVKEPYSGDNVWISKQLGDGFDIDKVDCDNYKTSLYRNE